MMWSVPACRAGVSSLNAPAGTVSGRTIASVPRPRDPTVGQGGGWLARRRLCAANTISEIGTVALSTSLSLRSSEHSSLHDGALEHCRSVIEILGRVAEPVESAEFRAWLLDLARGVAEASKESGFMGIGGTSVSERETDMLRELARALAVER